MRLWTREALGLADAAGFSGGMTIQLLPAGKQPPSCPRKRRLCNGPLSILVLTRSGLRSTELLLASLAVS